MLTGSVDFSVTPTGSAPKADDLFLCFDRGRVLLAKNGQLLPTLRDVRAVLPKGFAPFELAHAGKHALLSPHPFAPLTLPETAALSYFDLSIFRSMPCESAALLTSAYHLWSWYQSHRYCGCCAHTLAPHPSERALLCEGCGHVSYPVIAPAVIVAVTKGESILLAKSCRSANARYALISGFVEVGETLSHAVHREVLEEVGLHVKSLRYLGDQPWGIGGCSMFAFCAMADGDEPIILQKSELSDARWFHRSELSPREHTVSIAFELIERFRQNCL